MKVFTSSQHEVRRGRQSSRVCYQDKEKVTHQQFNFPTCVSHTHETAQSPTEKYYTNHQQASPRHHFSNSSSNELSQQKTTTIFNVFFSLRMNHKFHFLAHVLYLVFFLSWYLYIQLVIFPRLFETKTVHYLFWQFVRQWRHLPVLL